MNRMKFEQYLLDTYSGERVYPWHSYPTFAVFRHSNRKSFAIVMDLQKDKLGLSGNDRIDVVNLKCDPLLIGSLISKEGIFPAYHMNKEHWITVALDGSVPEEELMLLVDLSFEATMPKGKKSSK